MERDRARRWWLVTGVAALIALVAAVLAVTRSGDGERITAGDEVGAVAEVLREPWDDPGPDVFTEVSLAASTTPFPPIPDLADQRSLPTIPPVRGNPVVPGDVIQISGGEPGLYGGTRDDARCDVAQLVSFLGANPDKAGAWVAALNADPTLGWKGGAALTPADIPAYVATLTPVVLVQDTRVTNHGFRDGRPTPRQSVLQAGTAVLVDARGVPRVKCPCGNPLIPPATAPAGSRPPTFTGPTWPGFSPTKQGVVLPAPLEVTSFVLIELGGSGGRIERPVGSRGDRDTVLPASGGPATTVPGGPPSTAGGTPPSVSLPGREGPSTTPPATAPPTTAPPTTAPPLTVPPSIVVGTGDVQATLLWTGDADLDLHVIDPNGEEISFETMTSSSGGRLDVDQVPACGDTSTHVENVFWPTGQAPKGVYQVFVVGFTDCGSASSFQLEVKVGGVVAARTTGTLAGGGRSETLRVTLS